jgi:hypothetical protein
MDRPLCIDELNVRRILPQHLCYELTSLRDAITG